MADRNNQGPISNMSSLEQNVPASATHYSGAMFSGASHMTFGASSTFQVKVYEADRSKETAASAAPAGFTAGMTDLGPVSPFFTGRKDILSDLETYFLVEAPSTDAHEMKLFVLYGMGGAGKTQTALKFINSFRSR
ncbi:hypothetical protein GYMLUDRAFT_890687 [Collybiopsis luxurians FD-317 M1]|uniref:Unplaced genomic scaffold GYMLUscaffold_64, whole genome shotgun sequence n=1 Tax=Collybiopsis luxurians FD-317 M1 TaxID=944289 RepID=A0A0D0BY82_9AGAR|nr:hypothetical protein GYMLUDRAFT_890687 [Collybiopsis luxurians FD-317 M1]